MLALVLILVGAVNVAAGLIALQTGEPTWGKIGIGLGVVVGLAGLIWNHRQHTRR